MGRNKYINDYRLEETREPGGRRRTLTYIGGAYEYVLAPEAVRRERKAVLLLGAVGWALFLCALLPYSAASRKAYIVLPFLFNALSLGIVTGTVLSAPKPGAPMERRQAEGLSNRYPAASVFTVILSAASLLGEGIYGLAGGEYAPGDAVFSLCAALLAVCGAILLKKRRSFDTRKS